MKPLIQPDKPCRSCCHRRLRHTVQNKFHRAIWKCSKRDIEFGNDDEWREGSALPAKCKDYAN